ncbi:hypothetical protein [Terriglobus sp.]|uniref:hypothetical protein n=1 Tax=Terriglobus sp. TaxID=1889013 RepID=UPI003B0049A5
MDRTLKRSPHTLSCVALILASAVLLGTLGCRANNSGADEISAATARLTKAERNRTAACGTGATAQPSQSMQPRMPEQDIPACRNAAFEYEKALLDVTQTKRRYATPAPADR